MKIEKVINSKFKKLLHLYFYLIVNLSILSFLVISCNNKIKGSIPEKDKIISGIFTDTRDGQSYKWVQLKDGNKWMAQNLNFEINDSWCHDNDIKNCEEFGRHYIWEAAKKACPDGWRLPTDEEWWQMVSFYGMAFNGYSGHQKNKNPDSGKVAYATLIKGGRSGFDALLGGLRNTDGTFQFLNNTGYYWSSTIGVWGYYFSSRRERMTRNFWDKNRARSCRCIQD